MASPQHLLLAALLALAAFGPPARAQGLWTGLPAAPPAPPPRGPAPQSSPWPGGAWTEPLRSASYAAPPPLSTPAAPAGASAALLALPSPSGAAPPPAPPAGPAQRSFTAPFGDPDPCGSTSLARPNALRSGPAAPPPSSSRLFEPAMVIARVGDLFILAGDVLPRVNQALAPYRDQFPPDELEKQERILMRQALQQVIEKKLMYREFLRIVPKERLSMIRDKLYEEFDSKELEPMMKKAGVSTPAELDAELRRFGSSLQQQKDAFVEQKLGQAALFQKIRKDPEITHEEMLDYYRRHRKEFEYPARARWEQLTVRFDKSRNREEARRRLAWMGDQVLRGARLADIARQYSQDAHAKEGGLHDWTAQGSLASQVLDRALFTMPPGQLSPILEDERGVYIIRVLDRKEAGVTPFTDAQVRIKELLRKEKLRREIATRIAELREKTPVWTIFDQEAPAAATAGRTGSAARPY